MPVTVHATSTTALPRATPCAAGSKAERNRSPSALNGNALTTTSSACGRLRAADNMPDTMASGRYVPLVIAPAESAVRMAALMARPSAAKHATPRVRMASRWGTAAARGSVPNAAPPRAIVAAEMSSAAAMTLTSYPAR